MSELPPLSVLDDELTYEPTLGILRWNHSKSGRPPDLIAGYESNGYRRIHICGRTYQAHRIAFAMFHRRDIGDGLEIDHADGNPSNNKIENLREATPRQNIRNRICFGVQKHPKRKRNPYYARIRAKGKHIHIGVFPTEEMARNAYVQATREHFGEFSAFERVDFAQGDSQ